MKFNKMLSVHELIPFSFRVSLPWPVPDEPIQKNTPTLKIVHSGGFVEHYYMATPVAMIMEKYPSFVLTKPQVFTQPWDSIVQLDEILTPGNKFFVVPRRTVRKLQRRIGKYIKETPGNHFEQEALKVASGECFLKQSVFSKGKTMSSIIGGKKNDDKHNVGDINYTVKSSSIKSGIENRRVRTNWSWQPRLASIIENPDDWCNSSYIEID